MVRKIVTSKKTQNISKSMAGQVLPPVGREATISIRGARVHNLKNISLDIPRNRFVVITGLSGSGKSSLAFDTIYAEGQRRYVESLSAYARQFLGVMDKPDVEQIEGLSPAISIDQKSTSRNPRSTVGTITEIYDFMRLLFARIGQPYCPNGDPMEKQTAEQVANWILQVPAGHKLLLLAPIVRDRKGEHKKELQEIFNAGYARVRLDNELMDIEEAMQEPTDKKKKHSIDIVVDRLALERDTKDDRSRINDSVETAMDLGNGVMIVHDLDRGKDFIKSEQWFCPGLDIDIPEIEPRLFSFNSPHGACEACTGIGTRLEVDEDLIIPNKSLTIAEGAILPWSRTTARQGYTMSMLQGVAKKSGFDLDTPVKKLTKNQLDVVLHGTDQTVTARRTDRSGSQFDYHTEYEGVIPNLERRYHETDSDYIRQEIEKYMRIIPCPKCHGQRLKKEALMVKVGDKNIVQVVALSITDTLRYIQTMTLTEREQKIAHQIVKEIVTRLQFLENVGLNYLTLGRSSVTLSGGEAQRIRLATQIGSQLVGVLYVLDEPSIGLHQRDNQKLITTLKQLRDVGNTVLVVEHDQETIEASDFVVDIGPGAGGHGGEVVAVGTPAEIKKHPNSITGAYLSGRKKIEIPKSYRKGSGKNLTIKGATEHNLHNVSVDLPLGKFVAITGVSGSGKSTLMNDILAKSLAKHFYKAKDMPGAHKEIKGLEHLNKVITIDQSPIGRTPRSNPATYTGIFTHIRDLFTETPEAKMRGYKSGRFSFNVKGGRCEACSGDGLVKIEMHFLPDVYVECEECNGRRYNRETLDIHYKGKNIADVLNMTVTEAKAFFGSIPVLTDKLQTLEDVGLGYIHLGQSATTLSGGEAQRIKLASELSRRATGKTLYILDEPTTGLHFEDIRRLLQVLNQLVDKGNSVLIIEHNLDIIKSVDWIIDLGPEGGDGGGRIMAEGTPKDVAKVKGSYTGQFLKKFF